MRDHACLSGYYDRVEKHEIQDKAVYVFEAHNVAFAGWAEIKAADEDHLILITLDHHTDTKLAFLTSDFVHDYAQGNLPRILERIDERVGQIDRTNSEHIEQAVADLRNDEQIDAAVRVGLFEYAFCFNNQGKNTPSVEEEAYLADEFYFLSEAPKPPFTYRVPDRKIYEIGKRCAVGCEERVHGDECYRKHADQVIESVMLNQLITTSNTIAQPAGIKSILELPYVLDIDLDYFTSTKGLAPEDPQLFYEMIRGAVAITVATEPNYVKRERIDEELTSEYALERIMNHFEKALF